MNDKREMPVDPLAFAFARVKTYIKSLFDFYWPMVRHPQEFGSTRIRKPDQRSIVTACYHFGGLITAILIVNSFAAALQHLHQDNGNLLKWLYIVFMIAISGLGSAFLWAGTRLTSLCELTYSRSLLIYLDCYILVFAIQLSFAVLSILLPVEPLLNVLQFLGMGIPLFWMLFIVQPRIISGATGMSVQRSYTLVWVSLAGTAIVIVPLTHALSWLLNFGTVTLH